MNELNEIQECQEEKETNRCEKNQKYEKISVLKFVIKFRFLINLICFTNMYGRREFNTF